MVGDAARRAGCIAERPLAARGATATIAEAMFAFGILVGLVVFLGGLLFALGLIGDQKILIGLGLLLLALCAIFGMQPDWPIRRRVE